MKKALIGLFILWGLSWLWYQGFKEGWRQASEAAFAAVAALPAPPKSMAAKYNGADGVVTGFPSDGWITVCVNGSEIRVRPDELKIL